MVDWNYEVEFHKRLFRRRQDNVTGTIDAANYFDALIRIHNKYFPKKVEIVSIVQKPIAMI